MHYSYVDWREAIDLANIDWDSLNIRVMVVLEKHVGIDTSTLGTIKVTEHRIGLELNTK